MRTAQKTTHRGGASTRSKELLKQYSELCELWASVLLSPSTAWGSWCSASSPTLRDVHEYILVFSKGSFNRVKGEKENSISRDQFLEYTKSVWTFPAERAKAVGHPAPFPVELPRRLIELYTFKGDVVLDPFCGGGSTCLAAILTGRSYVGYEIKKQYVELAEKRIKNVLEPILQGAGTKLGKNSHVRSL